jgi:ABC-type dipeptide/oligopeptide/nickel transport system ATPase component
MMLITHDLGLVAGVAERVQVMYGGRLFETGDTDTIFYESRNPYTRALMTRSRPRGTHRAPLHADPRQPAERLNPPSGCVVPSALPDATDRVPRGGARAARSMHDRLARTAAATGRRARRHSARETDPR